jgi:hypothetical protein
VPDRRGQARRAHRALGGVEHPGLGIRGRLRDHEAGAERQANRRQHRVAACGVDVVEQIPEQERQTRLQVGLAVGIVGRVDLTADEGDQLLDGRHVTRTVLSGQRGRHRCGHGHGHRGSCGQARTRVFVVAVWRRPVRRRHGRRTATSYGAGSLWHGPLNLTCATTHKREVARC